MTNKKTYLNTNKKLMAMKGHKFSGINAGQAVSGVLGLFGNALNTYNKNSQIINEDKVNDEVSKQEDKVSTANSEAELLEEMAKYTQAKTNYTADDFLQERSLGSDIMSGISSGANAGSSAGGWGALIGGVAGGLSSIGFSFAGRQEAERKAMAAAGNANRRAMIANMQAEQSILAKANALDQAADAKALAAYAAYGGNINTPKFSDFPSEITEFNTGGSHEENPYDGIPQGIAPDGLPNLVEEGEVKYDNYIFSDRLMLNKNDKKKYKFLKGKTYADAAKAIKKELGIDERPNDLIAKTDLEEHLNILSMLQEEERVKRGLRGENRMLYSYGGHTFAGDYGQDYFFDADEATKAGMDWAPEPMPGLLGGLRKPKSIYATPSKDAFDFSAFDIDKVLSDYDEQGIEDPNFRMTIEEQPGLLSQVPDLETINPEGPLHNPSVQSIQTDIFKPATTSQIPEDKASNPNPVVSSVEPEKKPLSGKKSPKTSSKNTDLGIDFLQAIPTIASSLAGLIQSSQGHDRSIANKLYNYKPERSYIKAPQVTTPRINVSKYKIDEEQAARENDALVLATMRAARESSINPLTVMNQINAASYAGQIARGKAIADAKKANFDIEMAGNQFNLGIDQLQGNFDLAAYKLNAAERDAYNKLKYQALATGASADLRSKESYEDALGKTWTSAAENMNTLAHDKIYDKMAAEYLKNKNAALGGPLSIQKSKSKVRGKKRNRLV